MTGNPFVRLEAACASAVERTFAFAFPSALQPVQIARKLAAAFEAGPVAPRNGRRFSVRLHPNDHARLATDLPYLERQWCAMLARLAERSHSPQRAPEVASLPDASVAAGTVRVVAEALTAPTRLILRVRKGLPVADCVLDRNLVIGRDASCDFVLADPRVSRRHVALTFENDVRFRDLQSSNGTYLNRMRVSDGTLAIGDVLGIGDSELLVDAERSDGGAR